MIEQTHTNNKPHANSLCGNAGRVSYDAGEEMRRDKQETTLKAALVLEIVKAFQGASRASGGAA